MKMFPASHYFNTGNYVMLSNIDQGFLNNNQSISPQTFVNEGYLTYNQSILPQLFIQGYLTNNKPLSLQQFVDDRYLIKRLSTLPQLSINNYGTQQCNNISNQENLIDWSLLLNRIKLQMMQAVPINYTFMDESSSISSTVKYSAPANNRTPKFDIFLHRRILQILKKSANCSHTTWVCRDCFYTENRIHINFCKKCKLQRFPTLQYNLLDNDLAIPKLEELPQNTVNKTEVCELYIKNNDNTLIKYNSIWKCTVCNSKNQTTNEECWRCKNWRPHCNQGNKMKLIKNETTNDETQISCGSSCENTAIWLCSVCNFQNQNKSVICDMCWTINDDFYGKPPQKSRLLTREERIDLEWGYIIFQCNLQKKLFLDESFSRKADSLYFFPDQHKDECIKWLRIRSVNLDESCQDLSWVLFRDPLEASDVYQGSLGNCWFMSSLTTLIDRPFVIKSLFITKQLCPEGAYLVRLCKNGIWTTVLIDDFVPCEKAGCMMYSYVTRKQLWVPLIEKAAAKLFGCYEALNMGCVTEGLNLLTGSPCENVGLHGEEYDVDLVWSKLLYAKKNFFLLVASCGAPRAKADKSGFRSKGLYYKHLYSILDVREVSNHRLLQLRDPTDGDGWNGDWSDNSPLWTLSLRNMLLPYGPQVGIFWMSFEDFKKFFYNIGICRVRGGWRELQFSENFSTYEMQNLLCVSLIVFEDSEIDIILYQKNQREFEPSQRHYLDIYIVFLKKKNDVFPPQYEFVGYSERRLESFVCYYLKVLEPGEYLVVPLSFNHWHDICERNLKYQLSIHTSNEVFAELLDSTSLPVTIRDVIVSQVRSCGQSFTYLSGFKMYFLRKGFLGYIVMAENHYSDQWIHVKCGKKESNWNITSTRGVLSTTDSIPPLHGQVIAILSQLNRDEQFLITHKLDYRLSSVANLNDWSEDANSTHVPRLTDLDILHNPFTL